MDDETGEFNYDGIILAQAGVKRLEWEIRISEKFSEKDFCYAPGQGALGVKNKIVLKFN